MKQRRINATFTIAALALATFLILTALPLAGTAASRLEQQPSESLTGQNSTEATESSAPSVASVDQSPGASIHVSATLRSAPVTFIENTRQFDLGVCSSYVARGTAIVRSTSSTTTLRIVSDSSWRVSDVPEPGWEAVGFDDSSWDFTVAPAPVNCGWINCWYDPAVFTMWSSIQHQTIYLRRSFFLKDNAAVLSATIKSGGDDDHDLYINGELVASDWNGYAGPTLTTDMKPYLRTGTNIIAIKASDTAGGCRGMCVDATVESGSPTPFLDLPFEYTNFGQATLANIGGRGPGRINAWFDHTYPNYGRNYNLTLGNGRIYTGAKQTYDDCLSYGTCYDGHNGIDFSYAAPQPNEPGDQPLPIRPAASGNVVAVHTGCARDNPACGGGYGNYVIIDHQNGYSTRYAHLQEVYVSEGQSVTTDDTLGIMGATGHVEGRGDGTHLHLSVYYDDNDDGTWSENEVVDPFDWRGSPPEPWEANGGPTSYYLWIHQVSTQDPVSGDQGATMTDTTSHIQAIIPPGAFSGQAILELSPVPEAEPSAQLRSSGHSFWLRLLEWLLGGGGLQSAITLQNTTQFTLTKPITLTVTYTDTDVLHLDVSQLALHRWDEEQETWQPLTTTVDSDNHVATAQTEDLGDFDLQAPLLCASDDLEPDDGYAAARWMWPNDWPLARGLDIPQDSDWVRFDAAQGVSYTIRTQNLAGGADTVLNLYDVDALTLLASNDNADGGPASELVWTAPYTGTFFIETVSAPGGTTDCSATYELTIATIAGDVIANCRVDIADIMAVASRWRLSAANPDPDNDPTTPNYETLFDLDKDGDIDIVDIMLVVVHWGETCW